jgi:hypothetical protein
MASAKDLGQAAQEQASTVWNEAKETAGAKLAGQKEEAADGLQHLARTMRKAAHQGGDPQGSGRMADFAADGIERLSASLRGKDLEGLLQDAESFARRQPVAFFGAALAAGFVAVRFAKATRRDTGGHPASRGSVPARQSTAISGGV